MKHQGRLKAPENEGQLFQQSQRHGEEQDEPKEGDSATESLENSGVSTQSPGVTPSGNDHTQTVHKHHDNEAADQVVNAPANEGKVNEDLDEDRLINGKAGQDSEPEVNNPKTEDENGDNNNPQETADDKEDNDDGVDDRTERTVVYTDPNGIQFDVKVDSLDQPDETGNNVKVVGVAEKELTLDHEEDSTEKVDGDKVNEECRILNV